MSIACSGKKIERLVVSYLKRHLEYEVFTNHEWISAAQPRPSIVTGVPYVDFMGNPNKIVDIVVAHSGQPDWNIEVKSQQHEGSAYEKLSFVLENCRASFGRPGTYSFLVHHGIDKLNAGPFVVQYLRNNEDPRSFRCLSTEEFREWLREHRQRRCGVDPIANVTALRRSARLAGSAKRARSPSPSPSPPKPPATAVRKQPPRAVKLARM
jgi:hypothetical protein